MLYIFPSFSIPPRFARTIPRTIRRRRFRARKAMKVISDGRIETLCSTEFAFCIIEECVSRDMAGVHKRAWTKWRCPLCPMGVWQWTSALRIVTGLTNVFREGYHGCLASQWLGQHRLIIFYSTLCVLRHAAYVTRSWNYNYWTSAAYILENSSFAPHRSLNANKAELSLRYMSPFPRLLPLLPFNPYGINNNWANRIPLVSWYAARLSILSINLRMKIGENFECPWKLIN